MRNWTLIACTSALLLAAGCGKDSYDANELGTPAEDSAGAMPRPEPDVVPPPMTNGDVAVAGPEARLAQAERDHATALEQCKDLVGGAYDACKSQADAALEQARMDAAATAPSGP
jgi:hypothetical protein